MKKVTIYTSPTCQHCINAKEFFKENKVEYEEKSIEDEANAKEAVEKSGQQAVPIIDIEGKIIIGFDEDAVSKELGL
jgi:glutaredoxin 3